MTLDYQAAWDLYYLLADRRRKEGLVFDEVKQVVDAAVGVRRAVQIACDRCTLGVMDERNPHLWGECQCGCHAVGVSLEDLRMDLTDAEAAAFHEAIEEV